jgi:predicted RNA-binding protein with PUA-like domain
LKYWLMKSEPDTYSWDDLERAPKQTGSWDGVRNYQARNFMRDEFKIGDQVFFYHSSCAEPAIMGLAEVVREAYPDPTAMDPSSDYYDEKSAKKGNNPWVMVDVQVKKRFKQPITLAEIRGIPDLSELALLRPGQRLSVQPVSHEHAKRLIKLS